MYKITDGFLHLSAAVQESCSTKPKLKCFCKCHQTHPFCFYHVWRYDYVHSKHRTSKSLDTRKDSSTVLLGFLEKSNQTTNDAFKSNLITSWTTTTTTEKIRQQLLGASEWTSKYCLCPLSWIFALWRQTAHFIDHWRLLHGPHCSNNKKYSSLSMWTFF